MLFVIGFHVAILYALAAGLGYVKVPFEQPAITVVSVPTDTVEKIDPEPVKVDESLLKNEPIETDNVPIVTVDDTIETPPSDTAVVVTQPMTEASNAQPAPTGVRLLSHAEPPYPAVSRQQNEEGTVMVRVTITAQGRVADAVLETSSGYSRLDEAAVKAVRTWRFAPNSNSSGATTSVLVPVKFQLNRRG